LSRSIRAQMRRSSRRSSCAAVRSLRGRAGRSGSAR
jgi:hypothetical protein